MNQNVDGEKARLETRLYLEDYVRDTHACCDFEVKMAELLAESAVGTYEESTAAARLAIESCGASDVLMSFESIQDKAQQRAVIDVVNDNIGKYHS